MPILDIQATWVADRCRLDVEYAGIVYSTVYPLSRDECDTDYAATRPSAHGTSLVVDQELYLYTGIWSKSYSFTANPQLRANRTRDRAARDRQLTATMEKLDAIFEQQMLAVSRIGNAAARLKATIEHLSGLPRNFGAEAAAQLIAAVNQSQSEAAAQLIAAVSHSQSEVAARLQAVEAAVMNMGFVIGIALGIMMSIVARVMRF